MMISVVEFISIVTMKSLRSISFLLFHDDSIFLYLWTNLNETEQAK